MPKKLIRCGHHEIFQSNHFKLFEAEMADRLTQLQDMVNQVRSIFMSRHKNVDLNKTFPVFSKPKIFATQLVIKSDFPDVREV